MRILGGEISLGVPLRPPQTPSRLAQPRIPPRALTLSGAGAEVKGVTHSPSPDPGRGEASGPVRGKGGGEPSKGRRRRWRSDIPPKPSPFFVVGGRTNTRSDPPSLPLSLARSHPFVLRPDSRLTPSVSHASPQPSLSPPSPALSPSPGPRVPDSAGGRGRAGVCGGGARSSARPQLRIPPGNVLGRGAPQKRAAAPAGACLGAPRPRGSWTGGRHPRHRRRHK